MRPRQLFLLLFFSITISSSYGQDKRTSKVFLAKKFQHFTNTDATLNHANFFGKMAAEMQLAPASEMRLVAEIPGFNGHTHYRYKQYHKGLPIFANTYILHEKDGKIKTANGQYSPMAQADVTPSFSAEVALKLVKIAVQADEYADHNPTPTLCLIDPAFPKTSEQLRLVYQVDLETVEPFNKVRYMLDAIEGKIITEFPLIHGEGVPSTAKTKYYGVQNIITDSIGPDEYRLHDPTRGDGITIIDNLSGDVFTNNSPVWNMTNDLQDEVALDAHYCTQQYYDFLLEHFNWQGLDGNGREMICTVHNNGAGNVNAFWNGETTNYGDGDCLRGPLTTLEVVGHEWTHGVVDHTSDLVYSNESGAMNESLCDMMGKALERQDDPANFKWLLGHSFLLSPDAQPFRVMNDPASVDMPDYYKGDLWVDGAGVHTNSAVGNLWFSMIVDGKQGINEGGYAFDVVPIGMEKAQQIAFNTNRAYLTENSTYNDFYQTSVQTAEELYGAGSQEVATVIEGWKAVGLPYQLDLSGFDLSVDGGFFYERMCGVNEPHSITIEVANTGAEPYDSTDAFITLSTSADVADTSFFITDAILPGEVLSITVDDWFAPEEDGFFVVNIELSLSDDDESNHSRTQNYRIYKFHSDDLGINAILSPTECFSPVTEGVFYLANNSCDTIKAGTMVDLKLENQPGETIWEEGYEFEVDLLPYRTRFAFYDLELGLTTSEELIAKLDYVNDPDPENNERDIDAPYLQTIDADYLQEFLSKADLEMDNTIEWDHEYNSPVTIYQGESYFATTGRFEDPAEFVACPFYEDVFDYSGFRSGIYGEMRYCVDFSSYASSLMKFDLVQFRSLFAEQEFYVNSTMLQAKWDGNEEIIFGQTEGEVVNHEYPLPANFKGEISFKFYTELGDFNFSSSSPDLDFDVLMMDNFELSGFTSTTELERGNTIAVSPNPTNGLLNVTAEELMTAYELSSINGQVLRRSTVQSNAFEMDLSPFKNGMYLLRVQNATGEWAVRKVVKM